ncbi:DUF5011 domain-containing protein [Weissella coleopterorum]|uniref:DUF5011 domain-containing protein n=1 Tax=Weissella coleopterorum TaxID=2714949 RepID=A0A6G8B157_9LACO|nr:bacterial Ig-like domain-containing protein [Weissella coleopterorum]QIL50863.1 DUF5011 domain-containing protein [Weissella coleopterorum]
MKLKKYILISTIILGVVNPLCVFAEDEISLDNNKIKAQINANDTSEPLSVQNNNLDITGKIKTKTSRVSYINKNTQTLDNSDNEDEIPSTSVKTNFSTIKSSNNVTKMDLQILNEAPNKLIHKGDKIVLNIDSNGIQYSTLKLIDGSKYFSMKSDASASTITLTATQIIDFSGVVNISVTSNPTKNEDNTGKTAEYPLNVKYSRNDIYFDIYGENMILMVQNNKADQIDSFGPHLQGSLKTIFDSNTDWFNNYVGYDNYKHMYSYDQEGMLINAKLDNFVHDLTATNVKWGVTLKSDIYHSSSTIKKNTLRIYHGNEDVTNTVKVVWEDDDTGFYILIPEYKGYDKNQYSASFISNTNGNLSHVDGSSFVSADNAETGKPIEPIKNNDLSITLGSGDIMFRYYPTLNGSFIPHINAKPLTIYSTEKISLKDILNLANATDQDDGDITSKIKIVDSSDIINNNNIPGEYLIKYSVENSTGNIGTGQTTITILEDKTNIKVKNSTILTGSNWSKEDNFVSATDKNGKDISITDILTEGDVNTSTPGIYEIKYKTLNANNSLVDSVAKIKVVENKQGIKGSDVTTYVGDKVPADEEFKASATDKDGQDIPVKLDKSKINMNKSGNYDVIITTDDGQSKTVKVHVLENKQGIKGSDVTTYVGNKIPADEEFKASATDKDGQDIPVKLDKSKINMNKSGNYDVIITTDDGQSKTVKVHVLENKQGIKGSDVTTYVGNKIPADEEFKAIATDKDGQDIPVKLDKSQINMSKFGNYDVIITTDDGQSKTVKVHVLENKQGIKGSDVTTYVGNKIPADEEFKASATDKDGQDIPVKLDKSQINMSKFGNYDVIITTDDGQSKTVKVHVLENKQGIKGSDVTTYVGNKIPADEEFKASATDKDGQDIPVKLDKSQINMSKFGNYDVIITTDDGQSKTVKAHVLENKQSIKDTDNYSKSTLDSMFKNLNIKLPNTSISKLNLAGLASVVLALLAYIIIYNKRK